MPEPAAGAPRRISVCLMSSNFPLCCSFSTLSYKSVLIDSFLYIEEWQNNSDTCIKGKQISSSFQFSFGSFSG